MHCVQREDAGFAEVRTEAPVAGAAPGSLAGLAELVPSVSSTAECWSPDTSGLTAVWTDVWQHSVLSMLLKGPELALRQKQEISFLINRNQTQQDWGWHCEELELLVWQQALKEMGWQTKGYVWVRFYKAGALIHLLVPLRKLRILSVRESEDYWWQLELDIIKCSLTEHSCGGITVQNLRTMLSLFPHLNGIKEL